MTDSDADSIKSTDFQLKTWEPHFPSFKFNEKPPALKNRSIKPFASIICSSRNQGKSVLLRHLYENHWEGRFDLVIVFSETLGNGFYDEFIFNKTKYDTYSEDVLINLNNIQEKIKRDKGYYLNVLIIFDDMVSDAVKYSEEIQNLFTRGRHKGISICFITQSPTLIKSTWRQNTTYFFLLRTKGLGLQGVKDNFLIDLIDEEDSEKFDCRPDKFLNKLVKHVFAEQYRVLVVDYDKEGYSFDDCMFVYKANPKFKSRRRN